MNKSVNIITTLFGILLIPFNGYCLVTLEKFQGWDFLLVMLAAGFLLYVKNNRATEVISNILTQKNLKK